MVDGEWWRVNHDVYFLSDTGVKSKMQRMPLQASAPAIHTQGSLRGGVPLLNEIQVLPTLAKLATRKLSSATESLSTST